MIKIGLTGGIGSGKSVIARFWEEQGAFVVNADSLAKQLMEYNPDLKIALIEAFGDNVYNASGELNKPYLIEQAFKKNRVHELNTIVHPIVKAESLKLIKAAESKGKEFFVKEAALLLNAGRPEEFDCIVWVEANRNVRIDRVKKRDAKEYDEIVKRDANQKSFEEVNTLCDYVIVNNGSIEELKSKALDTLVEIKDRFAN